MAFVLADRVKETTSTSGTTDFVLSGAATGFQSFSAGVGANNTTYYSISDGSDWEIGLGTLSSDGLTLARTTILQSSNADAKVSFSSNSKQIFVTYPADKAVLTDATQTLTNKTLNSPTFVTPVLGTPSSGTVTNLTGTASININGTVGATTANTGAFTTLAASSTVSGTGFSTYLASPPAIGGTAAAAGTFTTLTGADIVSTNSLDTRRTHPTTTAQLSIANFNAISTGDMVDGFGPQQRFFIKDTAGVDNLIASTSAIRAGGDTTGAYVINVGTSGSVEGLRVTSTGVGIGTTAPARNLAVSGGASEGVVQITNTTSGVSGGNGFELVHFTNGQTQLINRRNNLMAFYTNNAERMQIDASGNLGVGTSSPTGFGAGYTVLDVYNGTNGGYLLVRNPTVTGQIAADGSIGMSVQTRTNHPIYFATNNTERARIESTGRLFLGTTSSLGGSAAFNLKQNSDGWAAAFQVTTNGNYGLACVNAAGSVVGGVIIDASSTSFPTSSDYRLKNTVAPMTGALAKVAQLKPVTYKWNADGSDGEGFIAHELAEVCPQAVAGEKDALNEDGSIKPQGIDTSFLVATLTSALQELNAKFEAYVASHP